MACGQGHPPRARLVGRWEAPTHTRSPPARSINAAAPNGTTPLMMAAYFGHSATAKLLLERGADPSLKNQMGFTAQNLARQRGHKDTAKLIASYQLRASQDTK